MEKKEITTVLNSLFKTKGVEDGEYDVFYTLKKSNVVAIQKNNSVCFPKTMKSIQKFMETNKYPKNTGLSGIGANTFVITTDEDYYKGDNYHRFFSMDRIANGLIEHDKVKVGDTQYYVIYD